jgi:O-antigen ligase
MSLFLVCVYLVLTIVHPMDWWDPILHAPLVNPVAIAAILFSVPLFLKEWRVALAKQPVIQALFAVLLTQAFSLIPQWWFGGMLAVFQEFGKMVILYLLIVLQAQNQRSWRLILWTVLSCNIWLAIHGILQFHTGTGFGLLPARWRGIDWETGTGVYQIVAYGFMNDPNDLCLMFIASIPLVWAMFRQTTNPALSGVGWGLITLFAYASTLTNSRGGYIGVAGTISTYLLLATKGIKRIFYLSIGFGVLMVLAPARLASTTGGDASRAVNWGEGLAAFKAHPIFGVGYGNYADFNTELQVAHNTYIHVLSETGLLGYVAFICLLYFTLIRLWRRIRSHSVQSTYGETMCLGLFASLLGYLLSCYFLSRQASPPFYILLALALGTTFVFDRTGPAGQIVIETPSRDWRKGGLLALASLFVLWGSVRLANAMSGL